MRKILLSFALLSLMFICGSHTADAQAAEPQSAQSSLVARVHDTGFIQLTADSFNSLTQEQKMDAYWLYRAAVAVDPIGYDQNSADGLREKHLLESILTHPNGVDPAVLKKITEYTMLFWGTTGITKRILL